MLYSACDKAKLFAKSLSMNSNFYNSGMSLPIFPSRTNLKLHIISITPKLVKDTINPLQLFVEKQSKQPMTKYHISLVNLLLFWLTYFVFLCNFAIMHY